MGNVNVYAPFEAYKGEKPYIFVSYAHVDGEIVFSDIKVLYESGYRIWYDEGIDPGNEWPEEIANALDKASLFLVFISGNSIKSRNVRNEINFALNKNISLLAVYLEDVDLPPGLLLRMGDIQAILKWRITTNQYHLKLKRSLSTDLCDNNLIEKSFRNGNFNIQYLRYKVELDLENLNFLLWILKNNPDISIERERRRFRNLYWLIKEFLGESIYESQSEESHEAFDEIKLKGIISKLQADEDAVYKISFKLSSILCSRDQFSDALKVLNSLLNCQFKDPLMRPRLTFEIGTVMIMSGKFEKKSTNINEGRVLIDQALNELSTLTQELRDKNVEIISLIYFKAGKLFQLDPGESLRQDNLFNSACELMPENPFFQIAASETTLTEENNIAKGDPTYYVNKFKKAESDLKILIDLGVDKVQAWFAIGHCHFFLDNKTECIKAYSNAVSVLLSGHYQVSKFQFISEIDYFNKNKEYNIRLAEAILLYLNIAMVISTGPESGKEFTGALRMTHLPLSPLTDPIIVVLGNTKQLDSSDAESFLKFINEILVDFKGTIICLGTCSGIPELISKSKVKIGLLNPVNFRLIGYFPNDFNNEDFHFNSYDLIDKSGSGDLKIMSSLICWADIILSGIDLAEVLVIGTEEVSEAEPGFYVALSLSARVCIIPGSSHIVADPVIEKNWNQYHNLIKVPNDPFTLSAIANQIQSTDLNPEEIETLAKYAHDINREKRLKHIDSNSNNLNHFKLLLNWEKLNSELKSSIINEVANIPRILKRAGLNLRKVGNPVIFDIEGSLSGSNYEMLARLEHARWNAEKLLNGWEYSRIMDLNKKRNPMLVAWDDLEELVKFYDYEPVKNFPKLLAKIGYEVYKVN